MTYAELFAFLSTLTNSELAMPVRVLVTGRALIVHGIHEGDGDQPMLDTGVVWQGYG
jgi:hypothetical protein